MLLTVDHITRYHYDRPVRGVVQSHRLTPSRYDGQKVLDWAVTVSGGVMGGGFRDGAGDYVQGWSVAGPADEITVHVQGRVETTDLAGVLKGHREMVPPLAYLRQTAATAPDAAIMDLSRAYTPQDALGGAHALALAVSQAITYAPGSTHAATTAAQALAQGAGVCQDHAQVLVSAARHAGQPARYVSGYLHSSKDGAAHEAAHAWAEIHIAGLGWVGFDPANHCCPDDRYIRLGSGFDAQDAAPIRGVSRAVGRSGAAAENLTVTVAIAAQEQ
ncbi:MAG: transglutaminase family protein [Cypionkella sp.]|nr:transglutaminase family protein [Cypionkella sp.]